MPWEATQRRSKDDTSTFQAARRVDFRQGAPYWHASSVTTEALANKRLIGGHSHNLLVAGFSMIKGVFVLMACRMTRTIQRADWLPSFTRHRSLLFRPGRPQIVSGVSPLNGGGKPQPYPRPRRARDHEAHAMPLQTRQILPFFIRAKMEPVFSGLKTFSRASRVTSKLSAGIPCMANDRAIRQDPAKSSRKSFAVTRGTGQAWTKPRCPEACQAARVPRQASSSSSGARTSPPAAARAACGLRGWAASAAAPSGCSCAG